jgi:hypothetical protein
LTLNAREQRRSGAKIQQRLGHANTRNNDYGRMSANVYVLSAVTVESSVWNKERY